MENENVPLKRVRIIEPTIKDNFKETKSGQIKVAAYCRVSTKQEEQLNSYETQTKYYTEKINGNPAWRFAGIFADKGITGTSVKKRDNFNKMIRYCKNGKIDMIIVKSISRFARNTVDCLHYTRLLKEFGVDVFFEEQGIHSIQQGAEFYITIYGSIAQSESENISANVKWGKAQSAKEGKVAFFYKNFLGYRKGANGKPEIDEEQAEVVRYIYERYLAGDSFKIITKRLETRKILTPAGKLKWSCSTIQSILKNERYKGDAIINKTFTVDCLSKKVKINNGERAKYYVENNHPAIIDATTFCMVQEEIARRNSKPKLRINTKTEQGKYSSKFALTELLVCGECNTPYRRCTWSKNGKIKKMWRCIKRLDYGKKYCHSPSIEEKVLHTAIMAAIMGAAKQNVEILKTLKVHIGIALGTEQEDDKRVNLEIQIAKIDAEVNEMLNSISAESVECFDEQKITLLLNKKNKLQQQLAEFVDNEQKRKIAKSRLDGIYSIIDGLKNHPLTFNDELIRSILQKVVVLSKEKIKVVFIGGLEIEQLLN